MLTLQWENDNKSYRLHNCNSFLVPKMHFYLKLISTNTTVITVLCVTSDSIYSIIFVKLIIHYFYSLWEDLKFDTTLNLWKIQNINFEEPFYFGWHYIKNNSKLYLFIAHIFTFVRLYFHWLLSVINFFYLKIYLSALLIIKRMFHNFDFSNSMYSIKKKLSKNLFYL